MDQRIKRQLELLGVRQDEVDDVYSGSDRWVVRYRNAFCLVVANRDEVRCRLETERRVLSCLRPCADVRIPEPVFDKVPDGVFVYKFIPGRLLDGELAGAMTEEEVAINTDRLSDFLAMLHNARFHGMDSIPTRNYFHHDVASVGKEQRVSDMLCANDLLQSFDRVVHLWGETESSDSREVGLIHGDFAGHNLIVGEHDHCVTGVIDFADCFIGDVHSDFRWFYRYGKPFWGQLIQKYVRKSGRRISDRTLQMYFLLDAFAHLFYAVTFDRPTSLAPGIRAVRELLAQESYTRTQNG